MTHFRSVKLAEVATVRSGFAFKSADWKTSGVPVIKIRNITPGDVVLENCGFVNEELAVEAASYEAQLGDPLISMSGATVGEIGRVRFNLRALVNQRVGIFRVKSPTHLDRDFLYHFLQLPDTIDYFVSSAYGSAQPNISPSLILDIDIPLPSLYEQQAIAEVLGALDDKITANTKLAATADEYIRANLADLTADIDDVITIGQLATNRKDLRDPNSLDPNANYVGLEHIPRRSMWLDAAGTADSVTSTKAGFQPGDVLFGKLRPYFHKVVAAPFAGICSTDILVVTSNHDYLADFVLASIASDYVVERVTAASEGTRMPRTSWKDLAAVEVGWPGEEKAREFGANVAALRRSIESPIRENVHLAATRDALLPQLMSGKLRVKDAETLLSASL